LKKKELARDDPQQRRMLEGSVGSEQEMACELINVLLNNDPNAHVVYTEGRIWEYVQSTGLWRVVPDDELARIVGSYDGNAYQDGKNERTLRITSGFVRGAIHLAGQRANAPGHFEQAAPVLVFADCALKISATGVVERLPLSPEHLARAGYSFKYAPQAKPRRFIKMLHEHFEGDVDAEQKIAALQEFFGACLFGMATQFQKCLALPSDGGSGRSTMLEIIEKAMPAGSVAHVDAKELRKPERRAKLPGKRLNFSDEVPSDAFLESEDFKKIIVGNMVSAEEKYKPSFDFRPIGGFVFPIQISASAELSDAFFRRFIIIRYNHNFEGSAKRKYDLAQRIIATELPALVTWMVEGASRLLKNKGYTTPSSHAEEESKWKTAADTVRAFLDTQYTAATFKEPRNRGWDANGKPNDEPQEPHDWTAADVVYTHYRGWCEENGHRKPVAVPEFKRRVEKIGYPQTRNSKGHWYGVRDLEAAQRMSNSYSKAAGKPPRIILGAVAIRNRGDLKIVK
jgi:phage/plasmid-associated DNA primase